LHLGGRSLFIGVSRCRVTRSGFGSSVATGIGVAVAPLANDGTDFGGSALSRAAFSPDDTSACSVFSAAPFGSPPRGFITDTSSGDVLLLEAPVIGF
jgi:hypothetical protein